MVKDYPIRLILSISVTLSLVNQAGVLLAAPGGAWGLVWLSMLRVALLMFLVTLCCCGAVFFILRTSPTSRPWLDALLAAVCCGFAACLIFFPFELLLPKDPRDPYNGMPALLRLRLFFLSGLAYDGIIYPIGWFYERLRKAEEERLSLERVKVENMRVRLDSLQQQMSPHFLFNCLNTLKSGAKEEWAKEFVLQLSRIYRYLLTLDPGSRLVPLADELDFLQAYIHVLDRRFTHVLRLSVETDAAANRRYLPPLTLQSVIRHALGPTGDLPAAPLQMRLVTEGEWLIVQHGPTPSPAGELHPDQGLINLQKRYRLLGGEEPVLQREGAVLTIKLFLFDDQRTHTGR